MSDGFAFLDGSLAVTHRARRPGGWEEHEGTAVARSHLGGVVNVSEVRVDGGLAGVSLKVRDPATGTWSIWWVDAATGRLGAPLRGRWDGAVGRFSGAEVHDGRSVLVAYEIEATATSAHWEQSRSADGGRTWAVDTTMDMTPTAAIPEADPAGDWAFLARDLEVDHRHRSRDGGEGWTRFTSAHRGRTCLDGTVSVDEVGLQPPGRQGLTFRARDAATGLWSIWWVSSDRGHLDPPVTGAFDADGVGTFVGAEDDQLVRFTWTDTRTGRPRWLQELSSDGGHTWVEDWEMAFH